MLEIRQAIPSDLDELLQLCREHAEYEGVQIVSRRTLKDDLASLLFTQKNMNCLVVTTESGLVGYASYTIQYATWTARSYLYLDCLYLREKARGTGIGHAIMTKIAHWSRERGIYELQW